MGRMAVAALLSASQVSRVTIADKNYEVAQRYIEIAGSEKLKAVTIDITDFDKLCELISAYDLVLNTVGPFYKFGVPILRAVIKASKNYVDICDDWKPTLEMLQLDAEAKAAGITAIIGIGASPGITNLLAVKACSELDEVEDLVTGWGISSMKTGTKLPFFINKKRLLKGFEALPKRPSAALLHLIHESQGKIPTFRNGKLTEIEALTDAAPIKIPGRGRPMYACHIGHPEPITLSRTLKAKSISSIMYLTSYFTDELRKYMRKLEAKQLSEAEVTFIIERELQKITTKILLFFWALSRFFKIPPELCAIAKGFKDGFHRQVSIGVLYRPYGEIDEGMDGVTAIPLVIAAQMLIDGKITKKGVLPPEEAIDPDDFLERYAKYCGKTLTAKDILLLKITDLL